MTEFIFKLLNDIGFTHPLHPAITHVPMGMIMGGFTFAAVALFFKKDQLAKTAHYCFILALIGILPTMVLGYLDWQHSFEGVWNTLIKLKIAGAFVLGILLIIAVKQGQKSENISRTIMVVYTLCLMNAIAMGFLGGELQYG